MAVVARPDADKGEQLIAATNKAELSADEIREAIAKAGLPNLAVPREIKVLDEIPVLGSGKTNYPELSKLVAGGFSFPPQRHREHRGKQINLSVCSAS